MSKKSVLFILFLVIAAVSSMAKSKPLLEFSETNYNFGTVDESTEAVVHEYEFINTSDDAVAVLSVSTDCGCTRPEYPVKPLAPGEKSTIKVTFKPAGQVGSVSKDIKVRYRGAKASSSNRITLRLKGTVNPKK